MTIFFVLYLDDKICLSCRDRQKKMFKQGFRAGKVISQQTIMFYLSIDQIEVIYTDAM